jgi:predicted secreted protein
MKDFFTLREKTLTPAEKKKREEIAKAIEKDQPDMPMDKKMAIATAQAKKVAEKADAYSRYTSSEVKKRQAEREKRNAGTTPAQRMKQKMYGNMMGGLKKESVEEARASKPPKLKGNDGPYTRQQIEKAAKEAKVDIGAKARMMMALRKM